MVYHRRAVDTLLDTLLPHSAAIAIEGPKAVGKTETALQRVDTTLHLDDPQMQQQFLADPTGALTQPGSILIDEWQQAPQSWNIVRHAVDDGAQPGKYLLTGSATPREGTDTHSGAGRILTVRMRPMAVFERPGSPTPAISMKELLDGTALGGLTATGGIDGESTWGLSDYYRAIAQSGFPELLGLPPQIRTANLDSYLRRIVDRELPDQGYTVRDKEGLMGWLRSYAAATSTTSTYETILSGATTADGDKPTKRTTYVYRHKLSEIWMLDPVPAWNLVRSPLARVVGAPKHQVADPALALRLLGVSETMLGTPRFSHLTGPLLESLATLSVRAAAEANFARVGHLRTQAGEHEVDLIVEGQDGQVIGIEIKLTAAPTDTDATQLNWLRHQIPDDITDLVILTTGNRAYRRPDGILVCPLPLLGA
ncbi:MAG: DUF4143 domain-containing protein [Corynebacterium sp.]|nr:DUF4143 domain-containing protein [Corynebacterium sp.]